MASSQNCCKQLTIQIKIHVKNTIFEAHTGQQWVVVVTHIAPQFKMDFENNLPAIELITK